MTYKLHTATVDYGATGEGRTMIFVAVPAESVESAKQVILERKLIDPYFMIGADVYEGLPPAESPPYRFLVSDGLKKFMEEQVDKLGCNLECRLSFHFNFS